MLKDANPKGRFWLKADACDLKAVLQHSMRGEWNGDCDLGDGKLKVLRDQYLARVDCLDVSKLQINQNILQRQISRAIDQLECDLEFLEEGLENAQTDYQTKFDAPNSSKATLMNLCWETVEFNTLLQKSQVLSSQLEDLLTHLNPVHPRVQDVARSLQNMREEFSDYLRNLYVKKRQPAATHVMVFMVSEERRLRKPYALPVQYVPYHSLKDQYIRDLSQNIKREMTNLGMKVVGG